MRYCSAARARPAGRPAAHAAAITTCYDWGLVHAVCALAKQFCAYASSCDACDATGVRVTTGFDCFDGNAVTHGFPCFRDYRGYHGCSERMTVSQSANGVLSREVFSRGSSGCGLAKPREHHG